MKELTLREASKQCCGNCGWSGPCMRIDEVACRAPISAADMKRVNKRVSRYNHMLKDEGVDCEAWKPKREEVPND